MRQGCLAYIYLFIFIASNSVYLDCLQSLHYCSPSSQKPDEIHKGSVTPRVICVFYCMSPPALSVSPGQYIDTLWCSFCLHSVDEDCVSSFPLRNRFNFWGGAEVDELCSSMRCEAAFRMKTTTTTTTTTALRLGYVEFFSYKKAIKHLSTLPIWVTETVSDWWLLNFRTSIGLCTSTLHVTTCLISFQLMFTTTHFL